MLQELTALRPAGERPFLVGAATARFRRAIRLRPEFDRACYNLGTVFYSHAVVLQNEAEGSASGSSDASQVGTLHMTSSLLACRTQRIRICGVIWLLLCVEQTNQRKAGFCSASSRQINAKQVNLSAQQGGTSRWGQAAAQ